MRYNYFNLARDIARGKLEISECAQFFKKVKELSKSENVDKLLQPENLLGTEEFLLKYKKYLRNPNFLDDCINRYRKAFWNFCRIGFIRIGEDEVPIRLGNNYDHIFKDDTTGLTFDIHKDSLLERVMLKARESESLKKVTKIWIHPPERQKVEVTDEVLYT